MVVVMGVLLPHSLLVLTVGEERGRIVVAVVVVVVATGCWERVEPLRPHLGVGTHARTGSPCTPLSHI